MSSAMREVSEEITKALKEMPVHTQQLFHMFHKHRVKMDHTGKSFLDVDRQTLEIAQSIGWRADGPLPNDIMDMPKGSRPDPATYLTDDYMREWREAFDGGVSRIQSKSDYDEYTPFRSDGDNKGFVLPKEEVDDLLNETGRDPRKIEQALGLDPNQYGDGPVYQLDYPNATADDVILPTGNETGVNDAYWLPGGKVPSGNFEGLIDGNSPSGQGVQPGITFGGPK